jgi:hypothetical protein
LIPSRWWMAHSGANGSISIIQLAAALNEGK